MQPAGGSAGSGPGPSDALSLLMDPSGHGSGGGAAALASLGPGVGGGAGAGGGGLGSASCPKERARLSAARMLRLGLLMAVTMTLHNLPEGFAVGGPEVFLRACVVADAVRDAGNANLIQVQAYKVRRQGVVRQFRAAVRVVRRLCSYAAAACSGS